MTSVFATTSALRSRWSIKRQLAEDPAVANGFEQNAAQRDLDLTFDDDEHDLTLVADGEKAVPGRNVLRVQVAGEHRKIGHSERSFPRLQRETPFEPSSGAGMNRRTTLVRPGRDGGDPWHCPGIRRAEPTRLPCSWERWEPTARREPFYGADRNFFKDAGFDVKITVHEQHGAARLGRRGGSLEIGYGSVIPLAQAHLRGLEFRVIAPATGLQRRPP